MLLGDGPNKALLTGGIVLYDYAHGDCVPLPLREPTIMYGKLSPEWLPLDRSGDLAQGCPVWSFIGSHLTSP